MTYTQPTITSDVGTFSPLLRLSAASTIGSRNTIHELIGGGIAVTFGGETLSTATLEMLFDNEADALDAYTQLNTGHIFQLVDTSKPSTSMYFVVSGDTVRTYQIESEDVWTITCNVQEVIP